MFQVGDRVVLETQNGPAYGSVRRISLDGEIQVKLDNESGSGMYYTPEALIPVREYFTPEVD